MGLERGIIDAMPSAVESVYRGQRKCLAYPSSSQNAWNARTQPVRVTCHLGAVPSIDFLISGTGTKVSPRELSLGRQVNLPILVPSAVRSLINTSIIHLYFISKAINIALGIISIGANKSIQFLPELHIFSLTNGKKLFVFFILGKNN